MKLFRLSLMCLLSATVITSCVKKDFDSPPDTSGADPHLPVNTTLRQLTTSALGLPVGKGRVLGDSTVYGIVVGDDRSGNIYKQIIIEDSAGGGMCVVLDKTNLYGDFPVGRKVYIKTNGLYLMNYKGLPEIVFSVDALGNSTGIPSSLINNYLVKASFPHIITPTTVTITDLYGNATQYLNTLIKLEHMQFDDASAGVPYSAAASSTNRTIIETDATTCGQTGQIVMYNSSYATFQPVLTPTGNGTIVGLMSIYISTPQLTLRDTTDVQFTGTRCP